MKLNEDEKMELAQDLAFDLDEFFRQNDPLYADAHPDTQAGKEQIADLLMDGKTAAVKEKLSEMIQGLDGFFTRIGRYEQAIGYEAQLDTDISVREMLDQPQEHILPDRFLTGNRIETPRGTFHLTDRTTQQMNAAGYGFHHSSDDGNFHIMANGTLAYAIVRDDARRTYAIYQLKDNPSRRDYAFEPLDRIQKRGLKVEVQNYEKVYSGLMIPGENLESIYTRFNENYPEDFTGHSLSVSDVVVIHEDVRSAAYYCDSIGFVEVPEFFESLDTEKTWKAAGELTGRPRHAVQNHDGKQKEKPTKTYKPKHKDEPEI